MQRNLTMFDLGCGLGGASAAMRDRGWTVYRIDRMRDVRADRYCDLRSLLALPQGLDLIWCSTSCQQFTITALPYSNLKKNQKPIDLSVELHVKELIDQARPRFWLVENVLASRKWLSPIFGPLRCRTGGHCLWGNVPLMLAPVKTHKAHLLRTLPSGRRRHLLASVIPYEISAAVAETVERLTADEESLCRRSM